MKKLVFLLLLSNLLTGSLFIASCRTQRAEDMNNMSMMMSPEHCQQMMTDSLGKADKDYDLRFINAMIPHHEGAILMAKNALKNAQHPEIKQLGQNIITAQENEIKQLKAWRKEWYQK